MTIQFLFVLRTISPCLATVLLFYRKNAFSMFAAPLLFISIAEAQPSVARRFLVVQKPFTYSCAIKSGITGLVPAVKIASGRARIVDRKWIAREIRALRTQRRLLSRFKKHPRVTAQATLASRLLIVKNFADRCASLTATVCDDGFKHSKV